MKPDHLIAARHAAWAHASTTLAPLGKLVTNIKTYLGGDGMRVRIDHLDGETGSAAVVAALAGGGYTVDDLTPGCVGALCPEPGPVETSPWGLQVGDRVKISDGGPSGMVVAPAVFMYPDDPGPRVWVDVTETTTRTLTPLCSQVTYQPPAPESDLPPATNLLVAASVVIHPRPNNGPTWEVAPDLMISAEVRDGAPIVVLDTITEEFSLTERLAVHLAGALLAALAEAKGQAGGGG